MGGGASGVPLVLRGETFRDGRNFRTANREVMAARRYKKPRYRVKGSSAAHSARGWKDGWGQERGGTIRQKFRGATEREG